MKISDPLVAGDVQVVAFDGCDLVAQITCQSGRDPLGRPHIEVFSHAARADAVDTSRQTLAAHFEKKGWGKLDGSIACPSCLRFGQPRPAAAALGEKTNLRRFRGRVAPR